MYIPQELLLLLLLQKKKKKKKKKASYKNYVEIFTVNPLLNKKRLPIIAIIITRVLKIV